MRKWIYWILIAALLVVFLFSAGRLLKIRRGYKVGEEVYSEAVEQFTQPAAETAEPSPSAETVPSDAPEYAPIVVDFEYLTKVNEDVIGWIYCPDTVINYPVVYGRDNSYYLERDYLGNFDACGTIFTDADNTPGFVDANVVLYGHHMQNNTMFAPLKYWLKQAFYEEHPVMWLLTPERDYRVDLFSAYVTEADSSAYQIVREPGFILDTYLAKALGESVIQTPVTLDRTAHYVVLTTCTNTSEYTRNVVHGMLVPLDSAGGVPLEELPDRNGQ